MNKIRWLLWNNIDQRALHWFILDHSIEVVILYERIMAWEDWKLRDVLPLSQFLIAHQHLRVQAWFASALANIDLLSFRIEWVFDVDEEGK